MTSQENGECESERGLFFPATTMTSRHHMRTVHPFDEDFLMDDLYPYRLHAMIRLLWLAGLPLPPRPLHQQVLLRRHIMIAEAIDLHLVWTGGVFFVKPLPRYLLDDRAVDIFTRQSKKLARSALGLRFSYMALIRYESDFHIAQEKKLLPPDLTWNWWQDYASCFHERHPGASIYDDIDERYWYGELRLGRLNKLCRTFPRKLSDILYGYSTLTAKHQKSDVFSETLRAIAATLAYFVIVLQAMQVGLTTETLSAQENFQRLCYGFAIFSMIVPLAALGIVLIIFLFLLVVNFGRTLRFEKARFGDMNIVPPRRQKQEMQKAPLV